jgi:hypothetical protein
VNNGTERAMELQRYSDNRKKRGGGVTVSVSNTIVRALRSRIKSLCLYSSDTSQIWLRNTCSTDSHVTSPSKHELLPFRGSPALVSRYVVQQHASERQRRESSVAQ